MREIDNALIAIGLVITIVIGTTLGVLNNINKAEAAGPPPDKITRLRQAVVSMEDPAGTVTPYTNTAAYGWHPGTDTPDRPDAGFSASGNPIPEWPVHPTTGKPIMKWPIVAVYPKTDIPSIIWYWDGSFRASNGYKWGRPTKWAYLRLVEEQWNPTTKQFEVPGLTTTPPPPTSSTPTKPGVHMDDVAGQQLVDILKRSFTWEQIMTFGDLSPYDEPDTGAPNGPLSSGIVYTGEMTVR